MAHDHHDHVDDGSGSGFSVGVLLGILILIVILAVLFFYVAPNTFNVNINTRSLLDWVAA